MSDWKIGVALGLGVVALGFLCAEPAQASDLLALNVSPAANDHIVATIHQFGGDCNGDVKAWREPISDDYYVECNVSAPGVVWVFAPSGDVYEYAGWGAAFAGRGFY